MSIDPQKSKAEAEVLKHNKGVQRAGTDRTCYVELCGSCQEKTDFRPHDVRPRKLRIVLKDAVLCMIVWLARWRCRKCRYLFTDFPDFVLPYKRYSTASLLELAQAYIDHDQDDASYRSTAEGGIAGRRGYQDAAGGVLLGEDALHHSTIWRSLSWLGSLHTSLQCAIDLILHRDSTSTVHRSLGPVANKTFRSQAREKQLRTARRLLLVMSEFKRVFKRPFFPQFATAAGVG